MFEPLFPMDLHHCIIRSYLAESIIFYGMDWLSFNLGLAYFPAQTGCSPQEKTGKVRTPRKRTEFTEGFCRQHFIFCQQTLWTSTQASGNCDFLGSLVSLFQISLTGFSLRPKMITESFFNGQTGQKANKKQHVSVRSSEDSGFKVWKSTFNQHSSQMVPFHLLCKFQNEVWNVGVRPGGRLLL